MAAAVMSEAVRGGMQQLRSGEISADMAVNIEWRIS